MDTLIRSSSLRKRPCCGGDPLPIEFSRVSTPEQMDHLLEAFLGLSDSSSVFLDLSLERLLESRASDSEQNLMIDKVLKLGSVLVEAGNRSARKRASKHNSIVWALPPDLTLKVFSILDTRSLCYAAATCSMFNKCAMEPLCYSNIDLTSIIPKVNNAVVSAMIQRAGKGLQSLKLGILSSPTASPGSSQPMVFSTKNSVNASGYSWNNKKSRQCKESCFLTRSCLTPLGSDGGAAGALLRRLHLYNIDRMDNAALCTALSTCPSLLDLEIVGLHVELRQTLESVSKNCHFIERLFFESSKTGRDDSLKSPTCIDLVNGCPHLTSLALRGFKLHDYKVRILVKGFRKLKSVDFSTSYSITGTFLRNLGSGSNGSSLEVIILRDCMHLKETEVARFLAAVLAGEFKFLRHLDISNREGLAGEADWYLRRYSPSIIPITRVLEERPEICFLAEFPDETSFIEGDMDSDYSLSLQLSLPFTSSSESSYSSDHGSGNEDGRDVGYVVYEESSDEVDILNT
ncbi:F-box protein SKIP17-like [Telopea speciosissima]|uniref:F-box protein SKIP17-like n=1 Tax=Telopea speciosissima TaxID=54955 RepID=UPI001CC50401|nr:F-box protein SKIP17-like [Telopea speciosissima]